MPKTYDLCWYRFLASILNDIKVMVISHWQRIHFLREED